MNLPLNKSTVKSFFALNISQRILLGFVLLLLVGFVTTSLNIVGMREFKSRFLTFNKTHEYQLVILNIDYTISELQRGVLVFSHSEKMATNSSLLELHQILTKAIDGLIADSSLKNPEENQLLTQMQAGVEVFQEKIVTLQAQKNDREALINGKLIALYAEVNTALMPLSLSAETTANKHMARQILQAQRAIFNAEVLAGRYFNRHEIQLRKQVEDQVAEATQALQLAVATPTHKTLKGESTQN
jgi:hypothetical protein